MPERGVTLDLPGWARGLNKVTHPSLLGQDELAEAVNIELGPRGELQLRRGFQPYFMDGAAHTGTGASYIWAACPPTPNALPDNPDPIVAVKSDGDIDVFPYDDTTGADLGAFGAYGPKMIAMNDKYYLTSSAAGVQPYEIAITGGPTVTATAKTRWNGTGTQTNQFPSARSLLAAYERVFAAGVVAGPNQGNSRLYFSDVLLPLSWDATRFIDVGPDDSEGITALAFFADQIVIFKQRSTWGLAGSDFTDTTGLSLYKIADVGAVNEQSIVYMPQGLLFVDPAQGVFLFDGSSVTNVGLQVFDYMKEGWNVPNVRKINSWRHKDKAYISVPWGDFTEPTRTFVWDGPLSAWTEHTYGFKAVDRRFVELENEDTAAGTFERVIGVGAAIFEEGVEVPPGNPIPAGVIFAWPNTAASIPANWTRATDLDGLYPKGIPDASTDPGTTGGSTTHTHTLPNHKHSLDHSHPAGGVTGSSSGQGPYDSSLGLGTESIAVHPHTHTKPGTATANVDSGNAAPSMATASNETGIPRKDVIFVESDGVDTEVPAGMLAIYHNLTPAAGWQLEESDGDDESLRPSYWRGAAAAGDGSLTKTLPANHDHTISAHTHAGTAHGHTAGLTGAPSDSATEVAGGVTRSFGEHKHDVDVSSASTDSLDSGGGGASSAGGNSLDNDPKYRTTSFVESVSGDQFVGLIGLWLGALADIPFGWALCDGNGGRPNLMDRYPRHKGGLPLNETGGGLGHTHAGFAHTHTTGVHAHAMTINEATGEKDINIGAADANASAQGHTHTGGNTQDRAPTVGSATHGTSSSTVAEPPYREVAFIQLIETTDPTTTLEEGVMALFEGSHDNETPIPAQAKTGFVAPESPLTLHRFRSLGFIIPDNDLDATMNLYVDGDETTVQVFTTIAGSTTTHTPRTRTLNYKRWRTMQLEWTLDTTGLIPDAEYDWNLSQATLEYSSLPSTRTQ